MIGKKTAAQLVLKDSQVYIEDKAYNAVCDLVAIEVLTIHTGQEILTNQTAQIIHTEQA